MNNDQKQMLLDLSKNNISELVTEFNQVLQKITVQMNENEVTESFEKCLQSLVTIRAEINKIEKVII